MVWIRVTRVMADTAAIHEPVLLNSANIVSIERMQEATYIYLRDGRHFAVTESVETLGAALIPVTMVESVSERDVYIGQDQQERSAIPSTTEYEYALPPQHILVPLDCLGHTRHVFDCALALAGKIQAHLTLLHILEMPAAGSAEGYVSVSVADYIRQQEVERRRALDAYAQQARDAGLRCDITLTHGAPFQQILDHARAQEVDLILMGTQGRTGLHHMFLGSVAEKVVRLAPCPVLVVHGKP